MKNDGGSGTPFTIFSVIMIKKLTGEMRMRKRIFIAFVIFLFGIIITSCSVFHTPEQTVDYKIIEQTAAMHITQTFEALPTATSTFTPEPTKTPEPTATEIPTPTDEPEEFLITRNEEVPTEVPPEPTATVHFPDKADFVAALPSPNQFVPNQHFYLTWQLKNIGTSTWSGKYRFYYSDGIQLLDQSSYEISDVVEPGGILTVTMPATAPGTEGTYKTTWILENPDGIPFYYINYVTIVGERTFITDVPELNPTETPSSLEWMCSDPERSRIQGDGCIGYCSESTGKTCYANGEIISYGK